MCPGAYKVCCSASVELQQSDCRAVDFDPVTYLLSTVKEEGKPKASIAVRPGGRAEGKGLWLTDLLSG